ncbi:hypothetical protein NUW58_g9523 [Xylaria curta]|uniref:Uncharacterized protein n=1 Tax=Xylaria curta TaxID=42375 RepID=A0ACC1MVM9_9PEZI|nr:hypothetical protein NUW58_g9523 [Xylaria curta]
MRFDSSVATQEDVRKMLRLDPRMIRHSSVKLGDGKLGTMSRLGGVDWNKSKPGVETAQVGRGATIATRAPYRRLFAHERRHIFIYAQFEDANCMAFHYGLRPHPTDTRHIFIGSPQMAFDGNLIQPLEFGFLDPTLH